MPANVCALFLMMLFAVSSPHHGQDHADAQFREGQFDLSRESYLVAHRANPKKYEPHYRLGSIALLNNKHDECESWLKKAIDLNPQETKAKKLLAMSYYRRDDFRQAAQLYEQLDAQALAKKLKSFQNQRPYEIDSKVEVSEISFLHTDPLPMVEAVVNGKEKVNLIIDTGGSELILDPRVAKAMGAPEFGTTQGTFGGGLQAATNHSRIESLQLGEYVIRHVPIHVLDTRRFAAAARGKRVDGVLGTVVLSHFLATLDYPQGKLILRRMDDVQLKRVEDETRNNRGVIVPFWLSGQHLMVAHAQVNGSNPMLLFVDTGLAGGGFVCPKSTLGIANITLPEGVNLEGFGGGGKMKLVPFELKELKLGDATEKNIASFFGPFPEQLEYREEFRIGGIVSHQFFRSSALTMDFKGMRLMLVKK